MAEGWGGRCHGQCVAADQQKPPRDSSPDPRLYHELAISKGVHLKSEGARPAPPQACDPGTSSRLQLPALAASRLPPQARSSGPSAWTRSSGWHRAPPSLPSAAPRRGPESSWAPRCSVLLAPLLGHESWGRGLLGSCPGDGHARLNTPRGTCEVGLLRDGVAE